MSDKRSMYIRLHRCEPGMALAEDIHNEYGAVVIKEGSVLDEKHLDMIKRFDIERVRIYVEEDSRGPKNSLVMDTEYSENVEDVKDLIYDMSKGKPLDIGLVNRVTYSLGTDFNDLGTVLGCINRMKSVDEYTYSHSVNVSLLCMLMGKWLKLDAAKINDLIRLGLLHDVGKGMIDPKIINKPDKLDRYEFEEIKKHPALGYKMLQNTEISSEICMGVLTHHEKEDGSGYPMGLKGNQISLYGKIVTIADIYAAMTSDRPYKKKECPFVVMRTMREDAFGRLDLSLLSIFFYNIACHYVGDFVLLDSGEIGEIVYVNPRDIFRPVIKVDNAFLDMSTDSSIQIVELI